MDDDLLIDFEDEQITDNNATNENETKKYQKEYDEYTTQLYKNMRLMKYNVISHDAFDCDFNHIFQYSHMWDPYTGEINGTDPIGPLCFHPDELINWFYTRRKKMLWIEQKDVMNGLNEGVYEGYYGDGLGSGENIHIVSRGEFPELYLFRLPIDDCYLPPESDRSIITMGPKLSSEEIKSIEDLAEKYHKFNYQNLYGKKRPSLTLMKSLYDTAISKTPDISQYLEKDEKEDKISPERLSELRGRANREAVSKLVSL
jgi:hypothetical protein